MDCRQAIELIGSSADGELKDDEQTALELHLAGCAECRTMADAMLLADAELRRAFAPGRKAAERLAERVISQLQCETRAASPSPMRRGALLAAAAAGFLFAVGVFRPWQRNLPPAPQHFDAFIARVALATGEPEVLPPETASWAACSPAATIETGSCVRTAPNVRCELDTPTGCQLRLDGDTEIKFNEPQHVELLRGQIWSNIGETGQTIDVKQAGATVAARQAQFAIVCQPGEAVVTVIKGTATVRGERDEHTIAAGEEAKIVSGAIGERRPNLAPLLETSWADDLLCLKGPEDPELVKRVDDILAQIGQAKLAHLYEDEIRRLGDRTALPLLRFIASERSRSDQGTRTVAARLVADLAPRSSIPDLINLLDDEDPSVRMAMARALFRLTGDDQGCGEEDWRTLSQPEIEACQQAWRQWWAENGKRARPPEAAPPSAPPPFQKARRTN